MKALKISDAEWQVMNVVWSGSPMTGGEIIAAVGSKSHWRPRTIRTLLDRLVEKGALRVLRDGKRRFVPWVSREACVHSESRSFMERVFGGEPAPMLLHIIKDARLTQAEIDQLKKILTKKEK
jgi:BlaI family penicillinase repressor